MEELMAVERVDEWKRNVSIPRIFGKSSHLSACHLAVTEASLADSRHGVGGNRRDSGETVVLALHLPGCSWKSSYKSMYLTRVPGLFLEGLLCLQPNLPHNNTTN